jgi:hypothetical protein
LLNAQEGLAQHEFFFFLNQGEFMAELRASHIVHGVLLEAR